jgi:hypothetical protein
MPGTERACVAGAFLFSLVLLISISAAQLGEVAGALIINVNVGSSNSTTLTIFNSASVPMDYRIVLPSFPTIANEISPTVNVNPMNGTIAPHTQIYINVTAFLPGSDTAGQAWQGLLQIIGVSNSTASGGAQLQAGLGKVVAVNSLPAKPFVIPYALIGVVAVIVVAGGGYYFVSKRRKASAARKKEAAKAAKPGARARKGAAQAGGKKTSARAKSDRERIRQLEAELAAARKARAGPKAKPKAKKKAAARKRTRRRR